MLFTVWKCGALLSDEKKWVNDRDLALVDYRLNYLFLVLH
jgi:hypothetical protein